MVHAARESDHDPMDVRPVAGPDDEDAPMDYSEVVFSAEDQPNDKNGGGLREN